MSEQIQHTDHLLKVQRESLLQTITDGAGRVRTFAANGLQEVSNDPKREHKFLSLDALLAFAKADCTKEKAAIFYDLKTVALVCDRHLMRDRCAFSISQSRDLSRWLVAFKQKGLIQHLQAWGQQVSGDVDAALMALHGLNLTKTVTYNNVHQDGRTVALNYTLDGGDPKSAKLPRDWTVRAPIHEGGPVFDIPLQLDLAMPDNERDSPTFSFTCITLEALKDESLAKIGDQVREELPGWLVLNATC